MSKLLSFVIIIAAFSQSGYGQSRKAWITAADTAYAQQDYYAAFKYYEVALEFDSTDTDIWYRYGNAARLFNAFPYAEKAYQKVIAGPDTSHVAESTFRLAEVKQRQGKYIEAIQLYDKFLEDYSARAPQFTARATTAKDHARWAADRVAEAAVDSVRHLGPEINTPYSEFGATLYGDTLWYSSFRFVFKKDKHNPPRKFIKILRSFGNGEGEPLAVSDNFNQEGQHTANSVISEDGSEMFYTICEYITVGKVRCDLYSRKLTPEGAWGAPLKLNLNADGYTSTQPGIGSDQKTGETILYFSSDRPGGEGGLDIWFSVRDENGSFGPAQNLSQINTPDDEVSPFFHDLSQQLFFSSDGYPGLGGLDIFKTKRDDGLNWTEPTHISHPINGSYNDMYYSLNAKGTIATFASDRSGSTYIEEDKEACCYDIYQADFDLRIDLLARTFNSLDNSMLTGSTVYLYEITPDGREILVDSITNPLANDFRFPLERYKKYRIEAKKPGFDPVSASALIDLTDVEFNRSTTIEKDLFLQPSKIDLQALTFDAEDRTPLPGTTVKLMEIVDGEPREVDQQTNEGGNDFLFPLEVGKTYVIMAEKPGYKPVADTIRFTPEDIARLGPRPTVELYLERDGFEDFLPLALYFDNDLPDRRSYLPTTEKTYGETYEEYYGRKVEFIDRFTDGLSVDDSFRLAANYENFFEREVREGFLDLTSFSEKLMPFLKDGNTITIRLKGYSSPRASTDYNLILSRRRIDSVKNHFEKFQDGALMPYLNNGQIKIEEEALGESTAVDVPDALEDEKNSIYSLLASVERRVEIIEVTTGSGQRDDLTSPDK